MIVLTRLSGKEFALNSDLIERVESTPDTVITLVDGTKYVVAEGVDVVVQDVRRHQAEVAALSRYLHVQPVPEPAAVEPPGDHGTHRPRSTSPMLAVVAPPTDRREGDR